jgi:hypothetical protein
MRVFFNLNTFDLNNFFFFFFLKQKRIQYHIMDTTLLGLVANTTAAVLEEGPGKAPTLTWVNVAFASCFVLVNGK